MFDFKTWMEKNSIITEDIAQKLNTELVDVNNIINSKDEDALWKLYEDYIQMLNDKLPTAKTTHYFSERNGIQRQSNIGPTGNKRLNNTITSP